MSTSTIRTALITALVSAIIFTAANIAAAAVNESNFPDISVNHPNFDAINYLNREGIFLGADDGNFYPDHFLNRAEFAAVFVRLSGADPDPDQYNNCFPDVKEQWFAAPVCFAQDQKWITGYRSGDLIGKFGPDRDVLDIEVLTMLARMAEWPIEETETWYEPALDYALQLKIYENEEPVEAIHRDDTAEIIFRMLATVALFNDEYSDELAENVYQYNIYDLFFVQLTDYDGPFIWETEPTK